MTHAKRERAHWNVGKGCKGTRKAKEKVYTDAEIEEQIASEDPSFRYRLSRRKRNLKAHLEYQVEWYNQTIAKYEGKGNESYVSILRNQLQDALRRLADTLK